MSYGAWSDVFKKYQDKFNYYIFNEDDYFFVEDNWDDYLIKNGWDNNYIKKGFNKLLNKPFVLNKRIGWYIYDKI